MRFITLKKEHKNYIKYSPLFLPHFCTYFYFKLCSFCWRGRKNISFLAPGQLSYKTKTAFFRDHQIINPRPLAQPEILIERDSNWKIFCDVIWWRFRWRNGDDVTEM